MEFDRNYFQWPLLDMALWHLGSRSKAECFQRPGTIWSGVKG